jgi:ABC-type transport system involved in cytochrome bd biosynthesis fused ATPase/permease subunit
VSLRGLVVAGRDGLPRSVPLELEMRAGDSVAVLCDSTPDAEALAETFAGRRAPVDGEVSVDGVPIGSGDRVVAVVAPGEAFVSGSLETNLAALAGQALPPSAAAAVREACGLAEVADALGGRALSGNGEPLGAFHRMLVLVARVIPSHYRILVVLDPMPWVNAVRGELWRSAVVRASVGRTALWVTADRALAARADVVLALRGGGLRTAETESPKGRMG